MIKGIGLKKINITQEEFDYYSHLIKTYSTDSFNASEYFNNLFDVDKNGNITVIKPEKNIPWAIIFFVQNLMINQRLNNFDDRLKKINA